ncbi:hypothetical protein [Mesoplasma melaleucae]|uniref:hypothetical protein n=1 Tax=Mesoplasma melaleucae TaxID=81459 RepID=UPI00068F2337|nr:hypothetical protein [Mesoplasma melaleucae]
MRWQNVNIISESDIISIETYLSTITKDDTVILITISGTNKIILELANKLSGVTKLLGIGDKGCKFKETFDNYISITFEESNLWGINSIKAQLTMQSLDYIFVNWIIYKNKEKIIK